MMPLSEWCDLLVDKIECRFGSCAALAMAVITFLALVVICFGMMVLFTGILLSMVVASFYFLFTSEHPWVGVLFLPLLLVVGTLMQMAMSCIFPIDK